MLKIYIILENLYKMSENLHRLWIKIGKFCMKTVEKLHKTKKVA